MHVFKCHIPVFASEIGNMYYLNRIEGQGSNPCSNYMLKWWYERKDLALMFWSSWSKRFPEASKKAAWLDINFCESCVYGKYHSSSFPKCGRRWATQLLEVVHSDICEEIEAKSLGGGEYFVTFIDDILKTKGECSRSSWRGKPWWRIPVVINTMHWQW